MNYITYSNIRRILTSTALLMVFTIDLASQCPEGESPIFTRTAQIDSFKSIYPNCDAYRFYGYYKNGVPVDPPGIRPMSYLVTMSALLIGFLYLSKFLFTHLSYFNAQS